MKRSRLTDSQIIAILKQAEGGSPVPELCREHGISNATFYKWRSKFGGMDASLMARMKELEDENRRLKKMGQLLDEGWKGQQIADFLVSFLRQQLKTKSLLKYELKRKSNRTDAACAI